MFDVWSIVGWWDDWQLRILVLGSLGIQWFLLVAAPMRKYTVRPCFRLCIWLAYISSDALAIYALATLFNRHARATSSSVCEGIANNKARILEVLWAPVLLIHLGGQEELTAYTIEDNELWTRHTVTLVSQVAVALYAFYKSWPARSDWKLLASAILLFIIGVVSFSEKPWALKKASINRLASVSATIQGKTKRTRLAVYLDDLLFSDSYNCFNKSTSSNQLPEGVSLYNCLPFTEGSSSSKKKHTAAAAAKPEDNVAAEASSSKTKHKAKPGAGEDDNVGLSEGDKVYMVLSDMSLSAAADDLVQRGIARHARDVLKPLSPEAEQQLKRWLRGAFGLIYTRANLVITRPYLVYHVLVVPILHVAALTLFATSDKDGYSRADVKITYIILCLTAALDVFAVFIRQLIYQAMSCSRFPALCETVRGYNLVDAVLRRRKKATGWLVKFVTTYLGWKEDYLDYCNCKTVDRDDTTLYKVVKDMVLADLVDAQDRDLANYRIFTVPYEPSRDVPVEGAGGEIMQQQPPPPPQQQSSSPGGAAAVAAANWALSEEQQRTACGPKIRSTLHGSFDRSVLVWHIATDLCFRMEDPPPAKKQEADCGCGDLLRSFCCKKKEEENEQVDLHWLRIKSTEAISSYMARLLNSQPDMLLTGSRQHLVSEAMDEFNSILDRTIGDNSGEPLSKDDLNKIIDVGKDARFLQLTIGGNSDEDKELLVPIEIDIEAEEDKSGICRAAGDLIKVLTIGDKATEQEVKFFHVPEACGLAKELLDLRPHARWKVMYRVWLGMLFYSASMCRGYLHAKSLGEGGEFLSYVWLVLSLKGAKTLADKLQMQGVEGDDEDNQRPAAADRLQMDEGDLQPGPTRRTNTLQQIDDQPGPTRKTNTLQQIDDQPAGPTRRTRK